MKKLTVFKNSSNMHSVTRATSTSHITSVIFSYNLRNFFSARFVLRKYRQTSSVGKMLSELDWPPLEQRRKTNRLGMMYKIVYDMVDTETRPTPARKRSRRTHGLQLERITEN